MQKETNTTQTRPIKHEKVIKNLFSNWKYEYKWLKLLQGAVEFKGRIPKSYIKDADYYNWGSYTKYYEIGETKKDARNARNQLIQDKVSGFIGCLFTIEDNFINSGYYCFFT